jgi:hypothetical protein
MMLLVVGYYNYRLNEKKLVLNYHLLMVMNDYKMDDKLMIPVHYLVVELSVLQLMMNKNDHK